MHLKVCQLPCPEVACFHRFWLKNMRNFRALTYPLNLNACKVTTENHLCRSLFLTCYRVESRCYIKKRLQHRCIPVNFAQFLRTPILRHICKKLLPTNCLSVFDQFVGSALKGLNSLRSTSKFDVMWWGKRLFACTNNSAFSSVEYSFYGCKILSQ